MKTGYDKFFQEAKKKSKPAERVRKMVPPNQDLKTTVQSVKKDVIAKKRKRIARAFPLGPVIMLCMLLGFGLVGSFYLPEIESWVESLEVRVIGKAIAEETAKTSETKAREGEKTDTSAKAESKLEASGPVTLTSEEVALFKGLDERRRKLDQREAELKKLEEELQKQKDELDQRLGEVEKVRTDVARQLEDRVRVDQERVDQLVSFYSSMKPQQAARIIETLNEDLAVEVLLKMKKKSVAEVMNLIDAQKAQRLSEKFAGYRRK